MSTLPWQANFAGLIGGIVIGIVLTFALVPFVNLTKYNRKSKVSFYVAWMSVSAGMGIDFCDDKFFKLFIVKLTFCLRKFYGGSLSLMFTLELFECFNLKLLKALTLMLQCFEAIFLMF